MSRMTVRLPTTLHRQLERLASEEGVSMNQYVVYALTRQAEAMHALVATTPAERQEARQRWDDLRKRMESHPTDEAVYAVLQSRELVDPEPDLSPAARDLILRLEGNPATAKASDG